MKRLHFARLATSTLALGLALTAAQVQAQQQMADAGGGAAQATPGTGGTADATTAPSAATEDVVVTANRTSQSLQKVSAAVQVVDGDKLRGQALVNVQQIFQDTPSVNVTTQSAGFSINIRGQGADLPSGSAQGAVALEFDGIYSFLSLQGTIGFFDTDRIEVLPGPQSTRYGPNADGGIVNVISTDPVLGRWAGRASVTVGNYGLVRGEVGQNIPISDTLALRVAGAVITRDSYYRPFAASAEAQSGRIKLLWQPSSAFSAKLQYEIDHVGGTGTGVEPRGVSKVAPYSSDSINNYANPWDHGDYASSGPGPDANAADLKQQVVTGTIDYRFAYWGAVTALGSYTNVSGPQTTCYAGGPPWALGGARTCYQAYVYYPFNQYTGELRFHNADGAKVLWNIGYYHFEYFQRGYSTGQRLPGVENGAASGTTTNAVYADLIYPVIDRLRLIGGVRESFDRRLLYNGNGVYTTFTRDLKHFDYRAGEEFDIGPNSMQYFTVSTGYRPGGITYSGAINGVLPFANEVNKAFEFGIKNRFFGNRLQLNVDAFYYDQSNYQVIDSYAGFNVLVNGASYTCTNGPAQPPQCSVPSFNVQAHNFGVEGQARLSLSRDDVIGVSATYLDARFNTKQGVCATLGAPANQVCPYGYNDQNTNALLFFDLAGAVQPHSPKIAATFTYQHVFRFPSGATLTAGGDAFHSSGYWVHPVQDAALLGYQPGYWLGNVSVTFAPAHVPFTLSGFVRNVSSYAVKQSTLPIVTIGDPRTYGGTLAIHW